MLLFKALINRRYPQFLFNICLILSVSIAGAPVFLEAAEDGNAVDYSLQASVFTDSASHKKTAGSGGYIALQEESIESSPNLPRFNSLREIIRTDTFKIHFSAVGAVPVSWDIVDESFSPVDSLKKSKWNSKVKIPLIHPEWGTQGLERFFKIVLYPSGQQPNIQFNKMIYRVSRTSDYEAESIQFESPIGDSGLQVRKTYSIPRRGFSIMLTLTLTNKTASKVSFDNGEHGLSVVLGPGMGSVQDTGGSARHDHVEAIYKTSKGIKSVRLKKKDTSRVFPNDRSSIEWAGLHSRYYMICLIPTRFQAKARTFKVGRSCIDSRIAERNLASEDDLHNYPMVELFEAPFSIGPNESIEFSYTVFAGPKSRKILRAMPYGLDKILFQNLWGWLRPLCLALMTLLGLLHSLFPNWGIAIIALSVVMRMVTFPVTRYGMKQQKIFNEQQAQLKPFLDELKKKYKDDADQRHRKTMKLYREHNFSPFAAFKSSVWILVQLPIFIALFQILSQSYEISGASFLWIRDLSVSEMLFPLGVTLPVIGGYFNLLPILMGVVQLIQGYMMNQSGVSDPSSKGQGNKVIYVLPITMMILFYSFASGLLLYWTTTNICQIFEQWVVNKRGDSRTRNECR